MDRIRAQRAQQDQQQPQQIMSQGGTTTTAPPATSIQVPQYNPVAPQDNFAGGSAAAMLAVSVPVPVIMLLVISLHPHGRILVNQWKQGWHPYNKKN